MTDCQQAVLCLIGAFPFVGIMVGAYHIGKLEGAYQLAKKQREDVRAEEELRAKISEEAMKQLKAFQKELNDGSQKIS